jgi:hypothetical protein
MKLMATGVVTAATKLETVYEVFAADVASLVLFQVAFFKLTTA